MASFKTRRVDKDILSQEQAEGVGARVRRSIGRPELRSFSPFLMLDLFNVKAPAGFETHPHYGFQTATYMLSGQMQHEDFAGHKGVIGPGSLQWMTAGSGIMHAEMPTGPEPAYGLQLWINLSAKDKRVDASYQELRASDIPEAKSESGDIKVRVIAGEALGVSAKIHTIQPVHYLHVTQQQGSTFNQPVHPDWNSFAFVLKGEGQFGDKKGEQFHTIAFARDRDADGVSISAINGELDYVLISGQPTPEEEQVIQYGPFVTTSESELHQVFSDFQLGRAGFKKAPGWKASIDRH